MNANEVLASLAAERLNAAAGPPTAGADAITVHPNDDVNDPLSSNDQFPSAIHIAATQAVVTELLPALAHLGATLEGKAVEFAEVVKSGRTHLMDATPVTLGQEFGGYAAQVRYAAERIEGTVPRVAELPLGGTAVGTGINAPAGFAGQVIAMIAAETGLPLTEARNHFEAQGARDALVELSGQLRTAAVSLTKIANDIRWMGSGPAHRADRDLPARPAARQLDHARQGQSGAVRGVASGGCADRRKRRRRGLERSGGQLRAQRDAAGDSAQRAGIDPAAGQRQPGLRRSLCRRHHRRRGALPRVRRVLAIHRHAA